MDRDRVNEIAQQITNELIKHNIIDANCKTRFEELHEDFAYNTIVEKLCEAMVIDYDD